MSGNPGNDSPYGGDLSVDCGSLTVITQLSSPIKEVIGKLKEGDILSIQIATDQGPVQAFTEDPELAGNVLASRVLDLVNCIVQGNSYAAVVLSIDGAHCKIHIRPI